MVNKKYRSITRFKSKNWTIKVAKRATEAKPGPDHEVIDALSNVSLGNWTKYQDFIDAVAELPDVLWIEMTNTQNDGLMVLFGEGTNNAR